MRMLRSANLGLLIVVLLLGTILGVFGGSVDVPYGQYDAGLWRSDSGAASTAAGHPAFERRNKFLNVQSLLQLAKDTSFVAVMAVGMTFVVISGGIDLSVGAIYALSSVAGAVILHAFGPEGTMRGIPPALGALAGVLVCLAAGTLCGAINGGLLAALRVHPFIVTLGTMAIFRGTAFVLTKGQSIGGFAKGFRDLIRWDAGVGLSVVPLLVMVFAAVLAALYLSRMAGGRVIYAVGGNETASRYSGIPVAAVKAKVYVLSGFTAAVAALLALGYYGSATSSDGAGYELNVIAAAVVGGASLNGGRGSAIGAVLGALIIQMISSGIVILGIDQNYSQIVIGAVIIAAVVLERLSSRTAFAPAR